MPRATRLRAAPAETQTPRCRQTPRPSARHHRRRRARPRRHHRRRRRRRRQDRARGHHLAGPRVRPLRRHRGEQHHAHHRRGRRRDPVLHPRLRQRRGLPVVAAEPVRLAVAGLRAPGRGRRRQHLVRRLHGGHRRHRPRRPVLVRVGDGRPGRVGGQHVQRDPPRLRHRVERADRQRRPRAHRAGARPGPVVGQRQRRPAHDLLHDPGAADRVHRRGRGRPDDGARQRLHAEHRQHHDDGLRHLGDRDGRPRRTRPSTPPRASWKASTASRKAPPTRCSATPR